MVSGSLQNCELLLAVECDSRIQITDDSTFFYVLLGKVELRSHLVTVGKEVKRDVDWCIEQIDYKQTNTTPVQRLAKQVKMEFRNGFYFLPKKQGTLGKCEDPASSSVTVTIYSENDAPIQLSLPEDRLGTLAEVVGLNILQTSHEVPLLLGAKGVSNLNSMETSSLQLPAPTNRITSFSFHAPPTEVLLTNELTRDGFICSLSNGFVFYTLLGSVASSIQNLKIEGIRLQRWHTPDALLHCGNCELSASRGNSSGDREVKVLLEDAMVRLCQVHHWIALKDALFSHKVDYLLQHGSGDGTASLPRSVSEQFSVSMTERDWEGLRESESAPTVNYKLAAVNVRAVVGNLGENGLAELVLPTTIAKASLQKHSSTLWCSAQLNQAQCFLMDPEKVKSSPFPLTSSTTGCEVKIEVWKSLSRAPVFTRDEEFDELPVLSMRNRCAIEVSDLSCEIPLRETKGLVSFARDNLLALRSSFEKSSLTQPDVSFAWTPLTLKGKFSVNLTESLTSRTSLVSLSLETVEISNVFDISTRTVTRDDNSTVELNCPFEEWRIIHSGAAVWIAELEPFALPAGEIRAKRFKKELLYTLRTEGISDRFVFPKDPLSYYKHIQPDALHVGFGQAKNPTSISVTLIQLKALHQQLIPLLLQEWNGIRFTHPPPTASGTQEPQCISLTIEAVQLALHHDSNPLVSCVVDGMTVSYNGSTTTVRLEKVVSLLNATGTRLINLTPGKDPLVQYNPNDVGVVSVGTLRVESLPHLLQTIQSLRKGIALNGYPVGKINDQGGSVVHPFSIAAELVELAVSESYVIRVKEGRVAKNLRSVNCGTVSLSAVSDSAEEVLLLSTKVSISLVASDLSLHIGEFTLMDVNSFHFRESLKAVRKMCDDAKPLIQQETPSKHGKPKAITGFSLLSNRTLIYMHPVKATSTTEKELQDCPTVLELCCPHLNVGWSATEGTERWALKLEEVTLSSGKMWGADYTRERGLLQPCQLDVSRTIDRNASTLQTLVSFSSLAIRIPLDEVLQSAAEVVFLIGQQSFTRPTTTTTTPSTPTPLDSEITVQVPHVELEMYQPDHDTFLRLEGHGLSFKGKRTSKVSHREVSILRAKGTCSKAIQPHLFLETTETPLVKWEKHSEVTASQKTSQHLLSSGGVEVVLSPMILPLFRSAATHLCRAHKRVRKAANRKTGQSARIAAKSLTTEKSTVDVKEKEVIIVTDDICLKEDLNLGGVAGKRLLFTKESLHNIPKNVIYITSEKEASLRVAPFQYSDGKEEPSIVVEDGITVKVINTPCYFHHCSSMQQTVATGERSIFLVPDALFSVQNYEECKAAGPGVIQDTSFQAQVALQLALWFPHDTLRGGALFKFSHQKRSQKVGIRQAVWMENGTIEVTGVFLSSSHIGPVLQTPVDLNIRIRKEEAMENSTSVTAIESTIPGIHLNLSPVLLTMAYVVLREANLHALLPLVNPPGGPSSSSSLFASYNMGEESDLSFFRYHFSIPHLHLFLLGPARQKCLELSFQNTLLKGQPPRSLRSFDLSVTTEVKLREFTHQKERLLLYAAPVVDLNYIHVKGGSLLSGVVVCPTLEVTIPLSTILHYAVLTEEVVQQTLHRSEHTTTQLKNTTGLALTFRIEEKGPSSVAEVISVPEGSCVSLQSPRWNKSFLTVMADEDGRQTQRVNMEILSENTPLKVSFPQSDTHPLDSVILRYAPIQGLITATSSVRWRNHLSSPLSAFDFKHNRFHRVEAQEALFLPLTVLSSPIFFTTGEEAVGKESVLVEQIQSFPDGVYNITLKDLLQSILGLPEEACQTTFPFVVYSFKEGQGIVKRRALLRVGAEETDRESSCGTHSITCTLCPAVAFVNRTGVEVSCSTVSADGDEPATMTVVPDGAQYDVLDYPSKGISQRGPRIRVHVQLPSLITIPTRTLMCEFDLKDLGKSCFIPFEGGDVSALQLEREVHENGVVYSMRGTCLLRNYLPNTISIFDAHSNSFWCQLAPNELFPLFFFRDGSGAFSPMTVVKVKMEADGGGAKPASHYSDVLPCHDPLLWRLLHCPFSSGSGRYVFSAQRKVERGRSLWLEFHPIWTVRNEHPKWYLWMKGMGIQTVIPPNGSFDLTTFKEADEEELPFSFAFGEEEQVHYQWSLPSNLKDVAASHEPHTVKLRCLSKYVPEHQKEVYKNSRVPQTYGGHIEMETFSCLSLVSVDGFNHFGVAVNLSELPPIVVENRTEYLIEYAQTAKQIAALDYTAGYIVSPKSDAAAIWEVLPLPTKELRFTVFEPETHQKVVSKTVDLLEAASETETILLTPSVFLFVTRGGSRDVYTLCFTSTRLLERQLKPPIQSLVSLDLVVHSLSVYLAAHCYPLDKTEVNGRPLYRELNETLNRNGPPYPSNTAKSLFFGREFDLVQLNIQDLQWCGSFSDQHTLCSLRGGQVELLDCVSKHPSTLLSIEGPHCGVVCSLHMIHNKVDNSSRVAGSPSTVVVKSVECDLHHMVVQVSDVFLVTVVDAFRLLQRDFAAFSSQWDWMNHSSRRMQDIFFRKISVSPLSADVSWTRKEANLSLPYQRYLFSSIEKAPLRIKSYQGRDIYMRKDSIASSLLTLFANVYSPLLLMQTYKVFGSLEVFGNPLFFIRCWGRGIEGFIQGAAHGEVQTGTKVLLREAATASLHSVSLLSTFGGRTFSKFLIPEEEEEGGAGEDSSNSVSRGIKSLVTVPVRRGSETGFSGVLGGVGASVTGVLSLPIVGALHGVRASSQYLLSKLEPTQSKDGNRDTTAVQGNRNFCIDEEYEELSGSRATTPSPRSPVPSSSEFEQSVKTVAAGTPRDSESLKQKVGIAAIAHYADINVFLECADYKEFYEWFPVAFHREMSFLLYRFLVHHNSKSSRSSSQGEGEQGGRGRSPLPAVFQLRVNSRTFLKDNNTLTPSNVEEGFTKEYRVSRQEETQRALHIKTSLGKESLSKYTDFSQLLQVCNISEVQHLTSPEEFSKNRMTIYQNYCFSFADVLKRNVFMED